MVFTLNGAAARNRIEASGRYRFINYLRNKRSHAVEDNRNDSGGISGRLERAL